MPNVPDGARQMKRLATYVGGIDGRALAAAVDAALQSDEPDLRVRTRLASSQMGRALEVLGGYSTGPVPIRIKKRMRKDAQIRFALEAAKAPLLSAPLYFKCRSTDVRALLNQTLLDSGFVRGLLESSLNAIEYGFQNHEALWRRVTDYKVEWDVPGANGGQETKSKDHPVLFLPNQFKDLDPEYTALLWDDEGALLGSAYGAANYFETIESLRSALAGKKLNVLSPEKMFLFTPIQEYQNYYGEGRLDWAYDHWYWGNILYLVAMRWYERKADPPLLARAPASAEVVPDPEDTSIDGDNTTLTDADARQDGLGVIARAAGRLRSHGVAAIPSEPYMDENGKPSAVRAWDIEEMSVQDMHPAFLDFIDHLDKKKTRAIFVPDTVMSRDRQVGSLGSVEAFVDIAVEVQNKVLFRWVRAFNEQVLAPFLAYNGIKDQASLVTPGVFRDNRSLLKDMILKAWEADMLAEQKLGRVDPNSLPVIFDRKAAAESMGLPVLSQDPDAPVRMIPLPDAGSGDGSVTPKRGTGVGSSPQTSQKGSAAAGSRKAAVDSPPCRKSGEEKADCVARKIETLISEEGMDRDQAVAAAHSMCEKSCSERKAGVGGEPDEGKALALAGSDYEADARRRAERAEDTHVRAAASTTFRDRLSTAEVALGTVLLWMVLRADKKDASGNVIRGVTLGDSIIWNGRKVRPAVEIAAGRDRMAALVAEYDGRGLSLAQAANSPVLAQTQRASAAVLAELRTLVNTPELDRMMAASVLAGEAEVGDILATWEPSREFQALDEDERDALEANNSAGLLLNIENIARRNGALMAETALMAFASGRQLGLIEDALGFRFNRLYSDLTLEAHLRAAHRGAIVAASRKSGIYHFMQTPSEDRPLEDAHDLDYWVGTDEFWRTEGERRGHPNPHGTFGWHHGSTTFWYPVPVRHRIQTPFVE